jgi:hypothetical protein
MDRIAGYSLLLVISVIVFLATAQEDVEAQAT